MKELLAKTNVRRIVRYAVYMFVVLLIQDMIFPELRILGVCPMILPAAVVAVALFEGVTFGVVFALIMGLFADMAFIESTTTFTLVLPIMAFAAGFLTRFFLNKTFVAYLAAGTAAIIVMGIVQSLRIITAEGLSMVLLTTFILQTLWSIPLAMPLYIHPARWSAEN